MTKQEKYEQVLPQIKAVIEGENDTVANMANVAAILHGTFGFWWTGFYLVKENELVLAPFQGPVACTRIQKGRGVCGTALEQKKTIIVENVHKFAGHIACSSESNSEIVVPIMKKEEVKGVIDIDSREFGTFDENDKLYLERVAGLLAISL